MQINEVFDLCCDANTNAYSLKHQCFGLALHTTVLSLLSDFPHYPQCCSKLSSSERPQLYTLITHMTTKPHVQECDFHGVTHIKPQALPPSALSPQQYVIEAQL